MEIFLHYSRIFVKGDFVIGRIECIMSVFLMMRISMISVMKIMREVQMGFTSGSWCMT